MDVKEYYHVFEAILYGLIMTKLFVSWNRMIDERKSIKIYWTHILITITIFLTICARYHGQLSMLHIDQITNGISFMVYIIVLPGALYFSVHQIFPNYYENVDFRAFFKENRPYFLYPYIIYMVTQGAENFFLDKTHWGLYAPHFIVPFLLIPAIHSKKLWPVEIISVIGFIYLICLLIIY